MGLNDYGTKEELIGVASTIRKTMFDFWMGKIDKKKFLRVYWEFEGFLLEHGYVEEDKYFKCEYIILKSQKEMLSYIKKVTL